MTSQTTNERLKENKTHEGKIKLKLFLMLNILKRTKLHES